MEKPLRKILTERGLTYTGLARLMGVNKTTVMRWEDGNISAERAVEIERITGISREALRPDLFSREVAK